MTPTTEIAELNDRFRTGAGGPGRMVITDGVRRLGPAAVARIIEAVKTFDDFEPNNPLDERDFGAFRHNGHRVFWQIDRDDPTNAPCILTIMLEDEYDDHCSALRGELGRDQ